ncbi:ATP-binding protein [Caballeronia sp. NK8]|uniref:ATP-binding protein n=1 Tax=Caballeronia sp. NK8 TaxID=140098 RepID=UPI0034647D27
MAAPALRPNLRSWYSSLFTRADASRSRQFGGSGLGLSVVRAIALAHRGRATFRPSAAGGLDFRAHATSHLTPYLLFPGYKCIVIATAIV